MLRNFIPFFVLVMPTVAFTDNLPPAMTADYSNWEIESHAQERGLVRNGNEADNELGGTNKPDAFRGAKGNDLLVGYDGVDVYTFDPGDGADVIVDLSVDGNRIKFREVSEDSVSISEVPGFNGETDRLIRYGDGDAIRIVGWSRLSDDTKSAWMIEHFFLPKPEAVPERSSPIVMLLTDPKSLFLIVLSLALGIVPLVRVFLRR